MMESFKKENPCPVHSTLFDEMIHWGNVSSDVPRLDAHFRRCKAEVELYGFFRYLFLFVCRLYFAECLG
jgi:hypothetical protein